MSKPQILLTNDDGIQSPGLWAAAESLSDLGYVHVVAPQDQTSGMGRSFPRTFNGSIQVHNMTVNNKEWQVFAVSGSPAQTVLHAVHEILPEKPDLVVSGINYGENLGTGVSASGTVGAAMESATMGIPSLAISLETNPTEYLSYSDEVDFYTAAYYTAFFGRLLLSKRFPPDVDLLKVDVPCDVTTETGWEVTRLSHIQYFEPIVPDRKSLSDPASFGYKLAGNPEQDAEDTDVYTLRVKGRISVTPLSLDFTSRINLDDFEKLLLEKD